VTGAKVVFTWSMEDVLAGAVVTHSVTLLLGLKVILVALTTSIRKRATLVQEWVVEITQHVSLTRSPLLGLATDVCKYRVPAHNIKQIIKLDSNLI
jgi:hypothetical protein